MISASLRGIKLARVPNDLIAGAMLAAIEMPEQIATARLAGMPVQSGRCAFAAGSLAFAMSAPGFTPIPEEQLFEWYCRAYIAGLEDSTFFKLFY